MKLAYEIIIVSLIFFLICLLYKNQQRISHNNGKGWDGVSYYKMAEQYRDGATTVTADMPFVKRIGTPFLIGNYSRITGTSLLESALIVNLAGVFVLVILLVFWLRRFINVFWIRLLLCLLFLIAWHAPLRYSFLIPLTTDAWAAVWLVTGLLLLNRLHKYQSENNKVLLPGIIALSIVTSIGILFRESNIALALAAPFILNPLKNWDFNQNIFKVSGWLNFIKKTVLMYWKRNSLLLFLPLLFAFLITIGINKLVVPASGWSVLKTTIDWFYEKSLPQFLLGIFIAYGPVLVLVPYYFKSYKTIFFDRQDLSVLFLIFLLFGLIGGTDTERILYMSSFPIIFIMIGISIKQLYASPQRLWLVVLLILQTLAYRFYWLTPDYLTERKGIPIPFFTLLGNKFEYLYLFSEFGHHILNTLLLIEYIVLFIMTGFIVNNTWSDFKKLLRNPK